MKRILSILLSVFMLSTCVALAEDATPEWMKPYDETVTITWGKDVSDVVWPEGESYANNYWVDWIKQQFNIELKLEWDIAGTDYMTQVNLASVDNSFPDVFLLTGSTAKQTLRDLIESGLVAPLNEAYDKYASDLLKDVVASYGGLEAVAPATVRDEDGNIYAFGNTSPGGEHELVWIRKDWLEKLNLPVPTTFDELMATARAFVEAKLGGENTYGFHITNSIKDQYNQAFTTSYLLHNFKAYPGMWYKNAEGNYVYGSVQPEVKEALKFLADCFAEGLLNKEFSTIDFAGYLANGECGISFGPWWIGAWPINNCKINDPDSFWEPIWVTHQDGEYHCVAPDPTNENRYYAVRADCAHPEVLIKMMNLGADQQNLYGMEEYDVFPRHIPNDVDKYYNNKGFYRLDWSAWPMALKLRYKDQLARMGVVWNGLVDRVKAGETIPEFNMESFDGKLIVDYMTGKDNSDGGQHVYTKLLALNLLQEKGPTADQLQVYNPAPTETMTLAWTNLTDMENTLFVKIVRGSEPLEAFDQFVKDWYAQGGQAITEEVDAQAKGK
jgi:putative aldouronate transport system substrate-binding protein